jgi:hypothetical protein
MMIQSSITSTYVSFGDFGSNHTPWASKDRWFSMPCLTTVNDCRLWDIIGEGEVCPLARLAMEYLKTKWRSLHIAVDEAG